MKHTHWFVGILVLLIALWPNAALACGLPLGATINYEQILLIANGNQQQLITSVQLSEAEPNAAVIYPVPAPATVDQPEGGEELFSFLSLITRPLTQSEERLIWQLRDEFDGINTGMAPGGGVDVLGRETLGAYDVSRLAADDPQALQSWLDEHGYTLPESAAPVLASYIADGWSFVAVRLADDVENGSLAPLRLSFTYDTITYPTRLDALKSDPSSVDLYVLTDHRVTVDQLSTYYAGPAAEFDLQPEGELGTILQGGNYLTRLRGDSLAPSLFTDDFIAKPAPNNDPFRQITIIYDDVYVFERYGLIILLIGLTLVGLIGFMIYQSRRGSDKVAG